MSDTPGPYGLAAMTYLKRGMPPIPIPAGQKKPPPAGWTGYAAPWPSGPDVSEWASNGHAGDNIAIRLPETVIGIDVDAYGDKPGAETFAAALTEHGPLPPTWISTSRDGGSGIRLYRVPAGRAWADVVGPGVEVIHYGHRYMMVAPSVHPDTAVAYRWDGPDGAHGVPGPAVAELPALTPAWVTLLDRGPVSERSSKAAVTSEDVSAALSGYPDGIPCTWLEKVLSDASSELAVHASRHDSGRHWCLMVVRAGEQGHVGSVSALSRLHTMWAQSLALGESRRPDAGEWERMVEGAVAIVTESPTPEADRGCCGSARDLSGLSFDAGAVSDALDSFWEAREVLSHVRAFARARRCSPWSVLGCVMARQVVRVRPAIVLPPTIGSKASLNLFVALVGASGMGKGTSEAAAADAVRFGQELAVASVGSGEGIAHLYAHKERKDGEMVVVRDREAVLFTVPEVDMLTALTGRQGATLLPQLRMAWSGESLGFAYADPHKALPILRHTYRMGLLLGVQPGRAAGLFADADGGTPQRFVWLPTTDPHAPEHVPDAPAPYDWPGISDPLLWDSDGTASMPIPAEASDLIRQTHWNKLRGQGDTLDGHALLARLKVAAALGLLEGRAEVTSEDWSLSATVMMVSDRTRERVQGYLASTAKAANTARAHAEGERHVIVSETVETAKVERVGKVLLRFLQRQGPGATVTLRQLRKATDSRDRAYVTRALDALLASGKVKDEQGEYGTTE